STVEYGVSNSIGYGVSNSIGYGVSSSVSSTSYSLKQINTAYPLPLDTVTKLSELVDWRRNYKKTRNEDLDTGIDDYPSYCDDDKKIHIDWDNVVGALMNVPIFVGTFSVMTDFAVLEEMDAYRDNEMGDVIFGKPFVREVGIKTRRFDRIITIYNGNDEVTYQMVRSHPRFKNHTNEQCNKIPPLLKVSEKDERNGISHAYQKFKGFYEGVLNLGPDYIRDAKMEE
ncbi:hypothetical protein Tco_1130189, partial [Tanacetum coccineum]